MGVVSVVEGVLRDGFLLYWGCLCSGDLRRFRVFQILRPSFPLARETGADLHFWVEVIVDQYILLILKNVWCSAMIRVVPLL